MADVVESIEIARPRDAVWAALADFGAISTWAPNVDHSCLTTADAGELQDILETIELLPRMEKTLVLLQKEVEVAKAQTEIRQHIEGEITQHQREVFLRETRAGASESRCSMLFTAPLTSRPSSHF